MGNIVVGLILLIIISFSIRKIISEKKKGTKCIGCPHSNSCSSCSSDYDLILKR